MTLAIETTGLTKRFGPPAGGSGVTAVDALSIDVEPNEIFGLLGPNGAGKTTTIKILTTLLAPSDGSARVDGFDVVRDPFEVRRRIGYVPQLISADGSLTGYENLLVFAKLYDLPRREIRPRVLGALGFMGLSDVADRVVKTYSGGMIRRLEIAQSLLHRPKVLFLDEPTVGLDPVARKSVWGHIRDLRAAFGTTILLTTHYMEEADALCSRLAILHQGKRVALGTPAELKAACGIEEATLDDVFVHYTGGGLDESAGFREAQRTRRTSKRLG